ncbi:MAG TPA: hypothetical protein VGO47_14530 [Chlamydiales bacterium]|jgi:hypothetical protein|nr:hypothetical protein [Chlamydiales bacterium]
MDPVAQVTLFLAVACTLLMGISRRAGDFVLQMASLLLRLAFSRYTASKESPTLEANILVQIPETLKLALSRFNLDGHVTLYAVCPACHCTFKPSYKPGSVIPIYPSHCTSQLTSDQGHGCNEPLLQPRKSNDEFTKPIKAFVYHHFHDFVAYLLSREDLEHRIDSACDGVLKSLVSTGPHILTKNFFEAEFVKSFGGPGNSPETLFIQRHGEARLLWVLNVDFFNPEGLRIRGATKSSGIISMACLNLGLDICYKPENMYIAGVVAGPQEPHMTELNHYLRPLIDDLLESWTKGVHYSKTASSPMGRISRSAIAIVACDLPAARKTAQLASFTSHFYCSVCQCSQKSTLGRVDYDNWLPRDNELIRTHAEKWNAASSTQERIRIFTAHGVRWSELWRLPYWDPSKQLIVDSMHTILEVLVQCHVRDILRLTTNHAQAPIEVANAFTYEFKEPAPIQSLSTELKDSNEMSEKEVKQIKQIHKLLVAVFFEGSINSGMDNSRLWPEHQKKLMNQLASKSKNALKFVCDDLELIILNKRHYKADYISLLVEWVSFAVIFMLKLLKLCQRRTKPLQPLSTLRSKISFPEDITFIRDVIRSTSTPSWLGSVPFNFGDAGAGHLKADEWRTLATVYLPLALIGLWGNGSQKGSVTQALRLQKILDHSMDLFCATRIIFLRTMTPGRMEAYRDCIIRYISQLKEVHPNAPYKASHHLSLHLYDFLKSFGPVRSWWTFPFERLIGILQHSPHNHKSGMLQYLMFYSH